MIPSKPKGVALIQVLIMTAIMSLIAIQFSKTARNQVDIANDFNDRVNAELLLKSSRAKVLYNFFKFEPHELAGSTQGGVKWNFTGEPFKFATNVTLSIQPASGFLSLVTTPDELLYKLLTSRSISGGEAEVIIASIKDWVDIDNFQSQNGAESNYYKEFNVTPRNGPLQHISELKAVRGITTEIYNEIANFLTIYPTASFNPIYAPNELNIALFNEEIAAQIVMAKQTNTLTETTWRSIVGNQIFDFVDLHPGVVFSIALKVKSNQVVLSQNFDIKINSQKSIDPIVILSTY